MKEILLLFPFYILLIGCATGSSNSHIITESDNKKIIAVKSFNLDINRHSYPMAFEMKDNNDSTHVYRIHGFCYDNKRDEIIMSPLEGWEGNSKNQIIAVQRKSINICKTNKIKSPDVITEDNGLRNGIIGFGLGFGITFGSICSINIGGALLLGGLVGTGTGILGLATGTPGDINGEYESCVDNYANEQEELNFLNNYRCL